MKSITVSIINIELQSEKYVQKPYPKYLHGLCYFLAGEEYPHERFSPPEFHPFIKQWRGGKWGTQATLQINSMNHILTRNILHSLERTKTIRLGHGELEIKDYSLTKQVSISLEPQEATPVPSEFTIAFVTPTKFRTFNLDHYETKAYPDLRLFIRSAARNLHILYGIEVSLEEQESLLERIILLNAIGYPVQAKIDKKEPYDNSFVGELHLSCQNLNIEQRKLFGLLLQSAKYMGIGHKKGYGFGHIKIKRTFAA